MKNLPNLKIPTPEGSMTNLSPLTKQKVPSHDFLNALGSPTLPTAAPTEKVSLGIQPPLKIVLAKLRTLNEHTPLWNNAKLFLPNGFPIPSFPK